MMAFKSTPTPPGGLSEETLAAVRAALAHALDAPDGAAELDAALRTMAREARANGVRAERLLVVLKEIWAALPMPLRGDRAAQNERLQRIVTLCIEEYYA